MMVLVVAVFTASVLGSLHCAGMCGAFLAIALNDGVSASPTDHRERAWRQSAYHLGRLLSYTTLGVIAGGLGAALNLAGMLGGVSRVAMVVAALTLIAFGGWSLLRISGVKWARMTPPGWLQKLSQRGHGAAMVLKPRPRALVIGLLTTLLPCGWLYAFVVTAAGTANPLWGGVTMMAFWFGTLPVMVGLGTGLQAATGVLGRSLPVVTCVLMMFAGVITLAQRSVLDPAAIAERVAAEAKGVETENEVNANTPGASMVVPDPSRTPACCASE